MGRISGDDTPPRKQDPNWDHIFVAVFVTIVICALMAAGAR